MRLTLANERLDFTVDVVQRSLDRIERPGSVIDFPLQPLLAPDRLPDVGGVLALPGQDGAQQVVESLELGVTLPKPRGRSLLSGVRGG